MALKFKNFLYSDMDVTKHRYLRAHGDDAARLADRIEYLQELLAELEETGRVSRELQDFFNTTNHVTTTPKKKKVVAAASSAAKQQQQRTDRPFAQRFAEFSPERQDSILNSQYAWLQKKCERVPPSLQKQLERLPSDRGFIWHGIWLFGRGEHVRRPGLVMKDRSTYDLDNDTEHRIVPKCSYTVVRVNKRSGLETLVEKRYVANHTRALENKLAAVDARRN